MAEISINKIYLAIKIAKNGSNGLFKRANKIYTTTKLIYKFLCKSIIGKV